MLNLKNYILFTKDGRKYGNALITGDDGKNYYRAITDYGNIINISEYELTANYWIGPEAQSDHKHFNSPFNPVEETVKNRHAYRVWSDREFSFVLSVLRESGLEYLPPKNKTSDVKYKDSITHILIDGGNFILREIGEPLNLSEYAVLEFHKSLLLPAYLDFKKADIKNKQNGN